MRWRGLFGVLIAAAAAHGGELLDAERLLEAETAQKREEGIRRLVALDSRAAVDALVRALRKAQREDEARTRAYDKVVAACMATLGDCIREIEEVTASTRARTARREAGEKVDERERLRDEKRAAESLRRAAAATQDFLQAEREYRPHKTLLVRGAQALGDFQARDAWDRIADVARHEKPGAVRAACLRALVRREDTARLPDLLALAGDRDPRIATLAAKGLAQHAANAEVQSVLARCAEDSHWQVRRAAYAALAKGPAEAAVPILRAARAEERGDQLRLLDQHLHALGAAPAPPDPTPGPFGLPFTSTNVRFVVDLGANERFERLREGLGAAIDALPEGAAFEIAAVGAEVARIEGGDSRRGEAKRWIERLQPGQPRDVTALFAAAAPPYDEPHAGKRVFRDLPDAVYLFYAEQDRDKTELDAARTVLWNLGCGATFHVVLAKPGEQPVLRALAEGSGGVLRELEG